MNNLLLTDCIRSTPARTVVALLLVGGQRIGAVLRRSLAADPISSIDDRTLGDIGLTRLAAFGGPHTFTGHA